jgi:outer membrane biosynthesis protein TonB
MRTALTISAGGHAALLLWSVITFVAKPHNADSTEAMPIDIISAADFSQLTAGAANAPKAETAKPLVEKIDERKPADDPMAKVEKKEVKAATDQPPPEPKPPAPAEKKPPAEPKQDLIADAIKKDEAKKPENKKAEAKAPAPPKPNQNQPKFDPRKVEALLNKQTPQRLAATGDALNNTLSLGDSAGTAAQLSQSEIDAFRARVARLWNPPIGAKPEDLKVLVTVKLSPDGRVVMGSGSLYATSPNGRGSTVAFAAVRDSAIRALLQGAPYDMFRPEHYDQWKELEVQFDDQMLNR